MWGFSDLPYYLPRQRKLFKMEPYPRSEFVICSFYRCGMWVCVWCILLLGMQENAGNYQSQPWSLDWIQVSFLLRHYLFSNKVSTPKSVLWSFSFCPHWVAICSVPVYFTSLILCIFLYINNSWFCLITTFFKLKPKNFLWFPCLLTELCTFLWTNIPE